MKRIVIAGSLLLSSYPVAAGVMQVMPPVQNVPALGGWGLGLLAVGLGGFVYRWFRSRDRH